MLSALETGPGQHWNPIMDRSGGSDGTRTRGLLRDRQTSE